MPRSPATRTSHSSHLMPDEQPQDLAIRQLASGEAIPYDLLLLADPSKALVDEYLPASTVFVAMLDQDPVGACVLFPLEAGLIEIKNVAVEPSHQGRGIGTALLKHAIRVAERQGYQSLGIGTANSSVAQLLLYQKLGFEIDGIKKNFFLKHYDELLFENGIQCKHLIWLVKSL